MTIVAYLMDGRFKATRHTPDCGVLARALREAEVSRSRTWGRGRRKRGYTALSIYGEDEWARVPGTREPRDHDCVRKAAMLL